METETALEWERRHWQRIETIFEQAEELPLAQQTAFLEEACGGDAKLQARVEALLAAPVEEVDEVGEFVAAASPLAAARDQQGEADWQFDEPTPERIGAYDIQHELGRGGSSSVFLAERADGTFRKHVALKLVRRGLDTQDILARMRQERQILARLDHPNISRLLDGGSTEDGRPYFVMEYVEGVPIDEYCRQHGLSVSQRIELFMTVCSAVHYAHRNLTIHRDIKPSNMLVTAEGVPKLLDFGIAKVLDSDESLTAWQVTRPGLRYMTPAFASPEQIRGQVLSTSTDVYSLGVLLFRLLTGAAPYDLEGLPFQRLEEQICELVPARPSQRLSPTSLAAMGLPETADRRLRSSLLGDLDTIIGMALRKEPERRYSSVEQLADDLRRHCAGLPVRAQPDHWQYRAGKFIHRHARALAAAAAMVLLLAVVVGFFSVRLIQERDRAFQAYTRAELESSKSMRVTDFLQQIFEISNPSRSLGESITAVQLLDRGAAQIESELAEEPVVQASLMAAISQSYAGLGLFAEAETQLERAFQLRQDLYDPPHEALAAAHEQLGELRISQGRYEDAEEHFGEALGQRRQVLGEADPKTAQSEADLGAIAHLLGRFEEAEERYRVALTVLQVQPGSTAQPTLEVQGNLVTLLYNQRRLEEAESLGRLVFSRQQQALGSNHPDTISSKSTLAAILVAAQRFEPAEPLLRAIWQRQRELLGKDHPDVALAGNNLAAVLFHLGRYDEAEPLYRQALEIQTTQHGYRHVKSVTTMLNLADLEARGRRNDPAARALYEQALGLRRSLVAASSVDLVNPLISLGELELRQQRPTLAARWLQEAVDILAQGQAAPAASQWRLAEARSLLGQALAANGETAAGERLLRQAADSLRAELGEDHPKTRDAVARLNSSG